MADPVAQTLCQAIENAGHVAYFVGGCVRNAIMQEPLSDIDIATDATPKQMVEICSHNHFRSVPTGIDHGTVTVVIDGQSFEVTTFRNDIETDGRRAVVAFSNNMADDARRRDFTMNALYADRHGTLFDPVGGIEDAQARHVRFIDDAGQRIREDYLRTLRFFRFHAQYADAAAPWDADALAGIADNLDGLATLSAERVGAEMIKLLAAPNPAPALSVMQQTGVLQAILPGADPTFVGPLVHLEDLSGGPKDAIVRLAALGGQAVEDRLRLSRQAQKHLESVQELAQASHSPRALGYLGGVAAGQGAILLKSAYANTPIAAQDLTQAQEGAKRVFPLSAKDLPAFAGPALGAELRRLKAEWLASDLEKTKDQLLAP